MELPSNCKYIVLRYNRQTALLHCQKGGSLMRLLREALLTALPAVREERFALI